MLKVLVGFDIVYGTERHGSFLVSASPYGVVDEETLKPVQPASPRTRPDTILARTRGGFVVGVHLFASVRVVVGDVEEFRDVITLALNHEDWKVGERQQQTFTPLATELLYCDAATAYGNRLFGVSPEESKLLGLGDHGVRLDVNPEVTYLKVPGLRDNLVA